MANYKTGAQRYNDRKDKIFARARELLGDDYGTTPKVLKGHGTDSPAMRSEKKKFIAKKMKTSRGRKSIPNPFDDWKGFSEGLRRRAENNKGKIKAEDIPF